MAGAQITTSVTILNSLLGYKGISLTNMTSTSEPQIAAGSKIETAGAFFTFAGNTDISGTSWTAITTAATAYVLLTPSGTAGSQIMAASWDETAPEWSTSKQGWYTTAGSNIRVVAGCTKTDETTWADKFMLLNTSDGIARQNGDFVVLGNITGDGDLTLGIASADRTIQFANDANLLWDESEDEFVFNKSIQFTAGKGVKSGVRSGGQTSGVNPGSGLYNILTPYIPNTGDGMMITGTMLVGGTIYIMLGAVRSDASTIYLTGSPLTGNIFSPPITAADGTSYTVAWRW